MNDQTSETNQSSSVIAIATWILKLPILLIVLLIWAVAGFFIWIAFLFRALTVYAFQFFATVITQQDPSRLHSYLDHVVLFYFRGFRIVALESDGSKNDLPLPKPSELIIQSVYTLAFWAIFAFGYRYDVLPLMWNWTQTHYHQLSVVFQPPAIAAPDTSSSDLSSQFTTPDHTQENNTAKPTDQSNTSRAINQKLKKPGKVQ